jgi:hypothetical protein
MSESAGPVTVISSVAEFEFRSLLGTEELGQPFRYEVEVLNRSAALPADKMLGSTMTLELMRRDGTPRYFNGYVTDFSLSGAIRLGQGIRGQDRVRERENVDRRIDGDHDSVRDLEDRARPKIRDDQRGDRHARG